MDTSIFPPMVKFREKDSVTLSVKFSAFKFVTSSIINFDLSVGFCEIACATIVCEKPNNEIYSKMNRIRRHINQINHSSIEDEYKIEAIKQMKGKITLDSLKTDSILKNTIYVDERNYEGFNEEYQKIFSEYTYIDDAGMNDSLSFRYFLESITEIPIHLQLNILDPSNDLIVDSLQLGDNNKILIAGIGISDSIELSAPLIAAILIFWMIFNIIIIGLCCWFIKRHQKDSELLYSTNSLDRFHHITHFDSLDRRGRVHWADHYNNPDSLHI